MQIAGSLRGTIRRHPGRWAATGIVAVGLVAFALYWFAPWNLFIDRRVDEALPAATATAAADAPAADEPLTATAGESEVVADEPAAEAPATGPVTLASGGFRGLEHETVGTALVVELEDGSRFLRLDDLETSNGPDLRVIVTDQPLSDDWGVWDDGDYVDLGPLKGNLGSSNYALPPDLDLSEFRTAVIWCRRFTVGFGVAPLEASGG